MSRSTKKNIIQILCSHVWERTFIELKLNNDEKYNSSKNYGELQNEVKLTTTEKYKQEKCNSKYCTASIEITILNEKTPRGGYWLNLW